MTFKIILLFVSTFLISSIHSLILPDNYTWPQNNKRLCFAGRFNLSLNVDYIQNDGAKVTAKIPLNNNTFQSYTVSCKTPNNIHELTISMLDSFTNILFRFSIDNKNMTKLEKVYGYITLNDKQMYLTNFSTNLTGVHNFSSNVSLFQSERSNSYRCNTKTIIQNFNTNENVTVRSIELENLRIQPFIDNSMDFSDYGVETICSADVKKDSNLIPIIVGGCLAALVIIVLVAYIIGRRRSRDGYQSV